MAPWWKWLPFGTEHSESDPAKTREGEDHDPCSPRHGPLPANLSAAFAPRSRDSRSSVPSKDYLVVPGDWLYIIGRRLGVDIRMLLNANPHVHNPDNLPAGSTLSIPSPALPSSTTSLRKDASFPAHSTRSQPTATSIPFSAGPAGSIATFPGSSPEGLISSSLSGSTSSSLAASKGPSSAGSKGLSPGASRSAPLGVSRRVGPRSRSPPRMTRATTWESVLATAKQREGARRNKVLIARLLNFGRLLGSGRAGGADKKHMVGEGESLEYLADKYGTTVRALQRLNGLKDDFIIAGSVLKVGCSGSHPFHDRIGRKALYRERNAVLNGVVVEAAQPVKPPMSQNPMFKPPSLKRGKKPGAAAAAPKPRLRTITVQFGDTLADIAYDHGLSIRELQRLNNLRNENIFEGDVLAVTEMPMKPDPQEVRRGVRRTTRRLFSRMDGSGVGDSGAVGGLEPPRVFLGLDRARKPKMLEGRWKKRKGLQRGNGWLRFNSPLTAGFVSSPFGWRWGAFHEGVDLAADHGTPVLASDKGVVTYAGWSGGYGYLVAIQHEGGFLTRYAHCCAVHARVGQVVRKGQPVGAVGATGHATGPHLHFEVRRNGSAEDPFKWVNL